MERQRYTQDGVEEILMEEENEKWALEPEREEDTDTGYDQVFEEEVEQSGDWSTDEDVDRERDEDELEMERERERLEMERERHELEKERQAELELERQQERKSTDQEVEQDLERERMEWERRREEMERRRQEGYDDETEQPYPYPPEYFLLKVLNQMNILMFLVFSTNSSNLLYIFCDRDSQVKMGNQD